MSSQMPPNVAERLGRVGGSALVEHVVELVSAARAGLDGTLAAAYVIGSIASDDVRGQATDLDLLLVTSHRFDAATLRSTGEHMAELAAGVPLRGLEAVVYRADVLATPTYPLPYELNVNGGRALPRLVDTGGTDAFWFLLDVAAARQHALTVQGPEAAALIAPVPDALVLDALRDSLHWHTRNGGSSPDVVLNACRAWHWLEGRSWLSKTAAGVWAVEHRSAPPIVDTALAARERGSDEALDPGQTTGFVEAVARRLDA